MAYLVKTRNCLSYLTLPLVLSCMFYYFTFIDVHATSDAPAGRVTINLQRTEFVIGEEIRASGTIGSQIEDEPVKVTWIKPNARTVIDQIMPNENGTYEARYKLDSDEDRGGRWSVRASYGGNETSLNFIVRDPFFSLEFDQNEYENGDTLIVKVRLDFVFRDNHRVPIMIIDPNGRIVHRESMTFEGPPTFYYFFNFLESNPIYGKWLVDVSYTDRYRTVASFDLVESRLSVKTDKNFPVDTAIDPPIATATTNSYSDTGLLLSTTYYYKVAAVDAAGNIGALSNEASATTGAVVFYDVPYPGNSSISLGSSTSTLRVGEQAYGSASQLIGKSLKEWTVYLKKTGSASGNVTAVVRRNSDDAIVATFNPIVNASTLPTSFAPTLFTLTSPHTIQYGDRIMIEYTGPGSVDISIWSTDQFDGGDTRRTRYQTSYSSSSASDVVGTMSTGSGSDTTPPSGVTGLTATSAGSSRIDLAWNANTEPDFDHYNVYRGTAPNFFVPGSKVTISGQIASSSSSDNTKSGIELSIFDPDGHDFQTIQTQLSNNNTFTHNLALYGPSAANYGEWFIVAKFEDHKGIAGFTVQKYPHTITLGTDQKFYSAGERITVLGRVSELRPIDNVKTYLYDPKQSLITFAEVQLSDDYTYRHQFNSDTLNLQPGNYTVAARHGNTELKTGFVISQVNNVKPKPITIETNNQYYNGTSEILVSGKISQDVLAINESLKILVRNNSTGELVYDSSSVEYNVSNGIFLQVLKEPVEQWEPSLYTINAAYGQEAASLNFEIVAGSSSLDPKVLKIEIGNGTNFDITYDITDGSSIKEISVDRYSKSLNIFISTGQDGKFKIVLPRELIDSQDGDAVDREYVVHAINTNGSFVESSFVEVMNASDIISRVLEIEFDKETAALYIQGTTIIPELGVTSMLVAAITMICVVILVTFTNVGRTLRI